MSAFEEAAALEARARELLAQARTAYERGADAGSIDALTAVIRLAVADGDYAEARLQLGNLENQHRLEPPERWVSVAPEVLGRGVSLAGADVDDVVGAGTFTVVTCNPQAVAAVLARVAPRLGNVNEHGLELGPEGPFDDQAFTPSFVFDPEVAQYAARIQLDTKGVMFSAMGRTMVAIIAAGLTAERIPAHITGYRADLDAVWRMWRPEG